MRDLSTLFWANASPDAEWQFQRVQEPSFSFDRAWRETDDGRLYVHSFAANTDGITFWHRHPQPMIVLVVSGEYELHIDRERERDGPGVATLLARAPFIYALTDPEAWHAVRTHTEVKTVALVNAPIDWLQPAALADAVKALATDETVHQIDAIMRRAKAVDT